MEVPTVLQGYLWVERVVASLEAKSEGSDIVLVNAYHRRLHQVVRAVCLCRGDHCAQMARDSGDVEVKEASTLDAEVRPLRAIDRAATHPEIVRGYLVTGDPSETLLAL